MLLINGADAISWIAAITKYNWEREEAKLLELYRDIESGLS